MSERIAHLIGFSNGMTFLALAMFGVFHALNYVHAIQNEGAWSTVQAVLAGALLAQSVVLHYRFRRG